MGSSLVAVTADKQTSEPGSTPQAAITELSLSTSVIRS